MLILKGTFASVYLARPEFLDYYPQSYEVLTIQVTVIIVEIE